MGKEWDSFSDNEALQAWTKEWATEALRVAKPGAFMLCFGGTRTFHRIACGIEDAGWEIRDTMMWVYGSGFPKSHNISKAIDRKAGEPQENKSEFTEFSKQTNTTKHIKRYKRCTKCEKLLYGQDPCSCDWRNNKGNTPEAQKWDGWGTNLKPAFEPIIVAMKPIPTTFAENALEHGVAGLWIDGGRVEVDSEIDKSQLRTMNRNKREADTSGQKWGLNKTQSDNPQVVEPKGRWPANLVHDGSEEVVELFPDSKGWSHNTKGENIKKTNVAIGGGQINHTYGDSGSAARFFYCAKASKAERNKGLDEGNLHPTVKPLALMKYLCRLTKTPDGGIVLDPFMGSGTTLLACKAVDRDAIGIELDEHYFEIAEKRINAPVQKELL